MESVQTLQSPAQLSTHATNEGKSHEEGYYQEGREVWTQFTKAEFVERMYLLVGVALMLWTTVGRAVEESEPRARLRSKTKGARLSLARIGSYYWLKMSKQIKLTVSFVREHLPPPRLRMFKWLMAPQK